MEKHRVDNSGAEMPFVPVSSGLQNAWPLWQSSTSPYPDDSRVVFLFANFDEAYLGMGRRFYDTEPSFRRAIDRCAKILIPLMDKPLNSVLWGAEGQDVLLQRARYANPAMFSLQYALAELWLDRGIMPDAVTGYGPGEFTAACIAGVFQLKDALSLVCLQAAMLETEGEETVANRFHSFLENLNLRAPKLAYISTLTGEEVGADLTNPEYWIHQMVWPTCFEKAVHTLLANDYHIFVEIGSKRSLTQIGKSLVDQSNNVWLASLRKGVPEPEHFRRCLNILFKTGVPVSLPAFEMLG